MMIHKTILERRPRTEEGLSQKANAIRPEILHIGRLNALRTMSEVAPASGCRK